jgi:biotin carboxyl carrier protein
MGGGATDAGNWPSRRQGERRIEELAQERVEFPITGKITTVNVKAGDTVQEGDVLCFLESMKMENPILAPVGGKIANIDVSAGQVVEAGDLAAVIESD